MGVGLGFISRGQIRSLKLERRLVGDLVWTSLVQGGLDDVMTQRAVHKFMQRKSCRSKFKRKDLDWTVALTDVIPYSKANCDQE